jgi:hypothetical protein
VDEAVESVDIVPTLLDVLGADLDHPLDGHSLMAPNRDALTDRRVGQRGEARAVPADGEHRDDALRRKGRIFGPGGGWESVLGIGPQNGLVGLEVAAIPVRPRDADGLSVTLDQSDALASVDLAGSSRVPALLTGEVVDVRTADAGDLLAIAVGEAVVAVARIYAGSEGALQFSALIPESALTAGNNAVQVFRVAGSEPTVLVPVDVMPDDA